MEPIERPIAKPHREFYGEEEVKGILERALDLQGRDFTRTHLEEMAEGLGITPAELQAAESSWLAEQSQQRTRRAFLAHRRRQYVGRVTSYFITIAVMLLVHFLNVPMLSGLVMPFFFVLFFTGWGLLNELYNKVFDMESDEFEEAYLEWRVRQERRQLPS